MKEKLNLVQKFREFYFALPKEEQEALFSIMTALRGEDNLGSCTLKTFTTARVRGALFGRSEKDFCNRALCFASFKSAKKYDGNFSFDNESMKLWRKSDTHFRAHIQSAIRALRKFGFKRTILDLMKFI